MKSGFVPVDGYTDEYLRLGSLGSLPAVTRYLGFPRSQQRVQRGDGA
jgi:hypothetical protein